MESFLILLLNLSRPRGFSYLFLLWSLNFIFLWFYKTLDCSYTIRRQHNSIGKKGKEEEKDIIYWIEFFFSFSFLFPFLGGLKNITKRKILTWWRHSRAPSQSSVCAFWKRYIEDRSLENNTKNGRILYNIVSRKEREMGGHDRVEIRGGRGEC